MDQAHGEDKRREASTAYTVRETLQRLEVGRAAKAEKINEMWLEVENQ